MDINYSAPLGWLVRHNLCLNNIILSIIPSIEENKGAEPPGWGGTSQGGPVGKTDSLFGFLSVYKPTVLGWPIEYPMLI